MSSMINIRRGLSLASLAFAFAIVSGCGETATQPDGAAAGVPAFSEKASASAAEGLFESLARRVTQPGRSGGGDVGTTRADAARFLHQATFGPNEALLAEVQAKGPRKFLLEQLTEPASRYTYALPANAFRDGIHTYIGDFCQQFADGTPERTYCSRDWFTTMPIQWDFFTQAVSGRDQLRQRLAWALNQIFVTSGVELSGSYGFAEYHQMLRDHAFGNFRILLERITLSPFMGDYLDMVNNDGTSPNENFARELLQLFSLGTCMLNSDGSMQSGKCVATYDNAMVREYAYALSGWTYPAGGKASGCNPLCSGWKNPRYYRGVMQPVAARHDKLQRTLLSGVVAPAGRTPQQALGLVLDSIMAHQNVAPFVARHLIQQFVTSNPEPAYVARVSAAFNAGRYSDQQGTIGTGVKGDMQATIAAVLLDAEARRPDAANSQSYGKLREPVLLMTGAIRALDGVTDGDRLGLNNWGAGMGQTPFHSPTVFNFFPPEFPVPGSGLAGPEFSVVTTNTSFARVNFVNDLVYAWYFKGAGLAPNASVPGAIGTRVDYSRWESLLAAHADSIKVVDRLNELLVAGRLTAAEKQAIVAAMDEYKTTDTSLTDAKTMSSWQRERVKTAAYLILASPQYQVQR